MLIANLQILHYSSVSPKLHGNIVSLDTDIYPRACIYLRYTFLLLFSIHFSFAFSKNEQFSAISCPLSYSAVFLPGFYCGHSSGIPENRKNGLLLVDRQIIIKRSIFVLEYVRFILDDFSIFSYLNLDSNDSWCNVVLG